MPKVAKQEKISESKSFLVQKYLGFQNLLDYLKIEWSEIYVKINELINNRSSFLESRFLTDSSKQPEDVIKKEIQKLQDDIIREIPTLKRSDLELITWGVITDWLIRCPLDF